MAPSVLLIGSFLALVGCGLPIAFCLGVSAFVTGMATGITPAMLVQRIGAGIQVFPLLAIPLFILAGGIMARGGVAKRIVDFAYVIVGPFRGGLAMVNCIDSMFFGGVSGHDGKERVRSRILHRDHHRFINTGDCDSAEP
jgi:TRAP-type mannitol/chloroaromatic compound transport system permease large subunit